MENQGTTDEQNTQLHNLDGLNLNNTESDTSSGFMRGKSLKDPILGSFCPVFDIPKKYCEPTILDTSLPHIPVYTHLKMYNLSPVGRSNTPPLLSSLRSKFFYRIGAESSLSSKTPLTGRTSKGRSSITTKWRESDKV